MRETDRTRKRGRKRGRERKMLSSMTYGMWPGSFVWWSSNAKLCKSFQTGHNTVHLPEHISSITKKFLSRSHSLSQRRGPIFYCMLWRQEITTAEFLVWGKKKKKKNAIHFERSLEPVFLRNIKLIPKHTCFWALVPNRCILREINLKKINFIGVLNSHRTGLISGSGKFVACYLVKLSGSL